MLDPILLFRDGGPWAFALLLAAPMAIAVALTLLVFVFVKWRVPLAAWLAGPALMVAISLLGTALGYRLTLAAADMASEDMVPLLLANGASVAVFVEILAGWVLIPVLLGSAWAVGAGGWLAATAPEPTRAHALVTAGIAGTTLAIGCAIGGLLGPKFTVAALPLMCFAFGTPAVVLATSRRSAGERAAGHAEQRISATVLLTLGALAGAWLAYRSGQALAYQALSSASPEIRPALLERAVGQMQMVTAQAVVVGLGGAATTAWVTWTDRSQLDGRTLASAALVGAVGLLLALSAVAIALTGPVITLPAP